MAACAARPTDGSTWKRAFAACATRTICSYFTAIVAGDAGRRQEPYRRALRTLPTVHIVFGKFKLKRIRCRVSACTFPGVREFMKPKEKRTDVNIALQLVDDALRDRADRLILVSGDSDLVPALNMVRSLTPPKELIVYVPSRHPSRGAAVELRSAADKSKDFPLALLRVSQFQNPVADGLGGHIRKPPGW